MFPDSTSVGREHSAISRDIRISTTNAVVETLCRVKVDFQLRVVRVGQLRLLEVLLHGFLLVSGLREVVGEATRTAEVGSSTTQVSVHHALGILDGLVGVEHGATDGGHVGAVRGVLGVEDLSFGSEASVGGSIAVEGSNTVVAGGEEDGVTLQAELQELIALTLGVGDGEIGLGLAVGSADDICGLVDSALELACFCVSDQIILIGGNGMLPL